MILEINEGVVRHFNELYPEQALRVYDLVLRVNGGFLQPHMPQKRHETASLKMS